MDIIIKNDFIDNDIKLEKQINEFENDIKRHIKINILTEYISFYIAKCFNEHLIFEENLNTIIEASLDSLSQMSISDCNIGDIKNFLIEKYRLKIVNDEPIKINY